MARIRSIKPEFWTSEQVMECSLSARLMFIGMWNFADDLGRLPLSAKTIKATIFPSDEISSEAILGMVNELSTNGLVIVYRVEEKDYLQITGWQHQRIDKPQPGKCPPPINGYSKTIPGTIPPDRKGEDRKGEDTKEPRECAARRADDGWPDDYREAFWSAYPNKVGKPKALAKLDACRKRGVAWQSIVDGLFAYIASKPADRQWLNPETFINQERWADKPAIIQGHVNGKTQDNPRSGSLIGTIDRRLAALEIEGDADPALPADYLLRLSHGPV